MIYHGWEMLSGTPHPLITVSLQPPHTSMLGGFLESDGKAGLESHSNSHVRATLTSFWASLSLPFRFAAVAGFQAFSLCMGCSQGHILHTAWHLRRGPATLARASQTSPALGLTQGSARSCPESLFSSQKHTVRSLRPGIHELISHPE